MHRKINVLLTFLIGIITILDVNLTFGQNYRLFTEPQFTVGNFNQVRLNTSINPDYEGTFYVYTSVIDHSSEFGWNAVMYTLEIFPPDDSTFTPLQHDTTYYYYFKPRNFPDSLSNIVESTQDTACPILKEGPILKNTLYNNWCKDSTIIFDITVTDSAGIDSIFIARIIEPDTNWLFGHCYYTDTSSSPNQTIRHDEFFEVPVEKDLIYQFIFGAKDAAHAAESCSTFWKLNGNRCYFPGATFSIQFDRTPPVSEITTPEQGTHFTFSSIPIIFSADDPDVEEFESGLAAVSLHYRYHKNPLYPYDPEFALYETKIDTGKTEIEDTVYFNFPKNDGWYEITTLAKDVATNIESDTTWVRIIFDTTKPSLESFKLVDTSKVASRFRSPITASHWTNDSNVKAEIDAVDEVSGLKRFEIFGDILDSETSWPIEGDNFQSCHRETLITLANKDAVNNLFCFVRDSSNLFSDTLDWMMNHDSVPPILDSISLYDLNGHSEITNDTIIDVKIHPNILTTDFHQVALIQDGIYQEIISTNDWAKRDLLFQDYQETVVCTLMNIAPNDIIKVYCVLKDYAGNVSESVFDSIEYVPTITIDTLSLSDISTNLIDIAVEGWTDSLVVYATISGISRKPGVKANFEFSQDRSFSSICSFDYYKSDSIDIGSRRVKLDLKDSLGYDETNGEKTVCVRLISESIDDTSNIECTSIFLDTIPPLIDSFSISDILDINNSPTFGAIEGWTDDDTINITINSEDTTDVFKGLVWGDIAPKDSIFEQISNLTGCRVKDGQGKKIVFTQIRDYAGNWSAVVMDSIIVDTTAAIIDSLILRDFDTNSEEKTDSCLVKVNIGISKEDKYASMGIYKMALFEDATFYPNHLDTLWKWEPKDTTYNFGYYIESFILNCAVRDSAGNLSNMVVDTILSEPLLDISFTMFDPDDTDDSIYTNNDTVLIKLYQTGNPTHIAFTKNREDLIPNDAIDDWRLFPETGSLEYSIIDPIEGKFVLFGIVKDNITNNYSEISSDTIIYDITPPILKGVGLTLEDYTPEKDNPYNFEFKADPGWTNDSVICALIDSCYDELSECDSLYFYGDIVNDTCFSYSKRVILPLHESKLSSNDVTICSVFVNLSDKAGNWSKTLCSESICKFPIKFENKKPGIKIKYSGPETIQPNTIINIPMELKDEPRSENISRVFIRIARTEKQRDYHDISIVSDTTVTFESPELGGSGKKEIFAVAVDSAGNYSLVDTLTIYVKEKPPSPNYFNAPNPFNPYSQNPHERETTIFVKSEKPVTVTIYDVFGNKVQHLTSNEPIDEYHRIIWNGRNADDEVADGVYLAVIKENGNFKKIIKIAVVKQSNY